MRPHPEKDHGKGTRAKYQKVNATLYCLDFTLRALVAVQAYRVSGPENRGRRAARSA